MSPEVDLPTDDSSCRAIGGHFGVVAGPMYLDGFDHDDRLAFPGLIAGPEGLVVTTVTRPSDGSPVTQYLGRVDFEGAPIDAPVEVGLDQPLGRVLPGESGAFVTGCLDGVPAWRFVDLGGEIVGQVSGPPEGSECNQPPQAAWTGDGAALVTWVEHPTPGGAYVALVRATPDGSSPPLELFTAGSTGPGPASAIAVGPQRALVVLKRFVDHSGLPDELVTQALDLQGESIGEPNVLALDPPGQDPTHFEVQAFPAASGGFVVLIGGYGVSMGRLRVGEDGVPLGSIDALPLIVDPPVESPYAHDLDAVIPTAAGNVAIGHATLHGVVGGLVTMFDDEGNPGSHVGFDFSGDVAVASYDGRTWAVALPNGPKLFELGCILPDLDW